MRSQGLIELSTISNGSTTYSINNAMVEGHVTKLKLIKRMVS